MSSPTDVFGLRQEQKVLVEVGYGIEGKPLHRGTYPCMRQVGPFPGMRVK